MIALNSAILFLTNLIEIILSAAFTFRLLGIRGGKTGHGTDSRVRATFLVLIMIAVILLLPLLTNVAEQKRRGLNRPLAYPVAAHVQKEVETYLETIPGITLITIARVSVDPTSVIGILLATDENLPAGFKEELTSLVRKVRNGNPTVRIITLREISEEQVTEKP
jgi:uncharacterized membrane protein